MSDLRAVEICAGAGGQALGLHKAGFKQELAVELDEVAAETLRRNTGGTVAVGDVADPQVWTPADYEGIDLFAGGVPCPPFSIAGKQLGASDERDLFAWAIEQVAVVKPRALMLENVRGLASARFSAYRQRVLDRLAQLGYVAEWRLLHAADFGVAQLRPRFVLVALKEADAAFFHWPETSHPRVTVGSALRDLMGANGWTHLDDWVAMADSVGPTLVGGSKKHGGADLGPTRAKEAWARLGVDGKGVADEAPSRDAPHPSVKAPRLTLSMVARLQGWKDEDNWQFAGRKTSQYRQIGNAFPPPVAEAVGLSIRAALEHEGEPRSGTSLRTDIHDPIYRLLSAGDEFVSLGALLSSLNASNHSLVEQKLAILAQDFDLESRVDPAGTVSYKLGAFKGFTGQSDHMRHRHLLEARNRIS